MPFGVANGPAHFQTYVDNVLAGLTDNTYVSFFNDILVYRDTRKEVVKRTQEVLQRLQKAGLFVKLEKCDFHV